MMKKRIYRAGAVKLSFWFAEFRKTVQLLADGCSWADIQQLSEKENVFNASTPARAQQIFNTVSKRVRALDESFIPLFLSASVSMQKIVALAAVLACDDLFFDFVYDVVREKVIIGDTVYEDREWRSFCAEKQRQDARAAAWTEQTVERLGQSYKTMLREAGILDDGRDGRRICRPILDPTVEQWMVQHGLEPVVKALTGVR